MNYTQTNKPIKLNLDKSSKALSEEEAFYLLNHERSVVRGKTIPFQKNVALCDVDQPDGSNFMTGKYKSPITKELYSWVYNSNSVHYIQRVDSHGDCQIVYSKNCLNLSADPEHSIEEWRAYLRVEKICSGRHGKYLVWVDGNNEEVFYLDVEASIATDSFTTPFFDRCPQDCAEIFLAVPKPCGCIEGEFLTLDDAEKSLTNHMVDKGYKFAFRQKYYDERVGDVSDISELFYQETRGCFDNGDSFPRCIKLKIPLGNPMVDKVEILYSTDNGVSWQLSDTVEKYESYSSVKKYWYERDISPDLDVSDDGCSFFYVFCNDKQCQAVDPEEISRVHNAIPIKPQGILPVKNLIGLYNYEQGNCPIDRLQVEKFKITANGISGDTCLTETATVKVRLVIHDLYQNLNKFIYRLNGSIGSIDDTSDRAYFGGFSIGVGIPYATTFAQNFEGKIRNFKPYIEGTDIFGEMEQYKALDGFIDSSKVGVLAGFTDGPTRGSYIFDGHYYYNEYSFKVKKGTKGFIRIQGIDQTGNNDNSSTFIYGTINDIHNYKKHDVLPTTNVGRYEIYFNTCAGDVDLDEAFVVNDNGEKDNSKAYFGYIKDANGLPIEGAQLYAGDDFYFGSTDHNGFYHFTLRDGSATITMKINVERDCSTFSTIKTVIIAGANGTAVRYDVTVDDVPYKNDFYTIVKSKVIDCNSDPVGGVSVAISGSKSKVTDSSGEVFFRTRNYSTRDRAVKVVVMDSEGCFIKDCSDICNPCLPEVTASLAACFTGHPEVDTSDLQINTLGLSTLRGLKKGGLYEWAVVAEGEYGKISSAYKVGALNMLKLQDTNKETFPSFHYVATGVTLPSWVKCLKILRSENLNPFQVQWVVDKIEKTTDGKIRLTIQSLNDFNSSYFFKTNTSYKWLEGDRVEFIKNGDGKVLQTSTYGLLNYQTLSPFNDTDLSKNTSADFFNQLLISDDNKLNDITEGAVIEIQRSRECKDAEPTFFSICKSISVTDGVPDELSGDFTSFDTFMVSRSIGKFAAQRFESKWPSDFWSNGNDNGFSDTGKAYFIDKYENSRRYGRNISFNSATNFNVFGDLVKTFDAPEQGDITAMGIKDGVVIMAIGENDSFLAQASNDLVKVGGDGLIRAIPADDIISDAQPKVKGSFGCQYPHIGSIYFGDGFVTWVDVNKEAYVKHDYSEAKEVSSGQAAEYFSKRCQDFEFNNRPLPSNSLTKFRFSTGYNRASGVVILTQKKLSDSGINNSKAKLSQSNETILFDPQSNDFTSFASYTAEGYGSFDFYNDEGCSFVSFLNGIPYMHTVNSETFNSFFGVAVDRVVGYSINKFPEKVKLPISLEIQDEKMWYVYKVTTDDPNFLSEIPPKKMIKESGRFKASFLGNKNGIGGLYGKTRAKGYAIDVILVRDNSDNLKYGIFDNSKRVLYDELDLITSKFMLIEQSGMTNNV